MTNLVLGLGIFIGVHSVSVFGEAWRDRMADRLGKPAWQGLYSLVSIAGFVLLVKGYAAARLQPVVLYVPPGWTRHVAMTLMLPVFPLILAAYLPGRIKDRIGHPMLAGTMLWALCHLLTNGMLADVVLFGTFLLWARVTAWSMRRRTPRSIPGAPRSKANDAIAVVAGLGVYALVLLWGHQHLAGVALIAR